MKLRNKKTGEIPEKIETIVYIQWSKMIMMVYINSDGERIVKQYDSLETFNEEWEDYEEPKEYWYIEPNGVIARIDEWDCCTESDIEIMKTLGNYFETKEEAEKAVEKLKAWKLLKDAGCKIVGWEYSVNVDLNGCKFNDEDFIIGLSAGDIDEEDLDLLFGGEE